MNELVRGLLSKKPPYTEDFAVKRFNCFNAVQLYWGDAALPVFVGPEEFVAYLRTFFIQLDAHCERRTGDVMVVWSRSQDALPIGQIEVQRLQKSAPGYPFGLVIEHACVKIDELAVFQKRDPTDSGPYEVVPMASALRPYLDVRGFELTMHRRVGP